MSKSNANLTEIRISHMYLEISNLCQLSVVYDYYLFVSCSSLISPAKSYPLNGCSAMQPPGPSHSIP